MKKESRTARYDHELHLEAFRFEGIEQPFPDHFHDYYVVGFVEAGARRLSCRNKEYTINKGDILLLGPGDSHGCTQSGPDGFDYRGLNIPKETMCLLAEEISGEHALPVFSEHVVEDEEIALCLRSLHSMIMNGSRTFEKEELLLLLIERLIRQYGQLSEKDVPEVRMEIEKACAFMAQHYFEHLTLEDLCRCSHLSRSTLLRAFIRAKGVTPYRYLQSIRIGHAKKLLEQGVRAADAAQQTGFSDQSHFSNYFTMFIGISPYAYARIFKEGGKDE